MTEQAMDVRSSAAFLRQRWRILAAAAAVGMALGCLYVTRVPPELGSTTLVLLPAPSGSPGDIAPDTQVQIALSTPVLTKAGKSIKPVLSAAEVKRRTKVATTTPQLIEIQGFANSAEQAEALSQAVADSYIERMRNNAQSVVEQPVADLQSRSEALTKQINALQDEITATSKRASDEDPNSVPGRRDAQLLAQLTAEQANVALQLDQVKKALSAYETSDGTDEARIIQPAAPAEGPTLYRRLITRSIFGSFLAVAVTALVLLIRRRRDPRIHARDDMADAVGSSVLAEVRSRPQRSVAEWLAFFENHEPSAVEAWAFRQVLRRLVAASHSRDSASNGTKTVPGSMDHPSTVTVIAFSGDHRGMAVGPQLAACAASMGITTRFIAASGDQSAAALRAACATERSSQLRSRLFLESGTDGAAAVVRNAPSPKVGDRAARLVNGQSVKASRRTLLQAAVRETRRPTEPYQAPAPHPVDLTIVLVMADRKEPASRAFAASAATVLAIAPGVGTREELARLAVAVDDAGARIHGIVVADPDTSDRTTGRRTLDERAQRAPLPVRLTGVSQVSMSTSGPEESR